MPEKVYPSFRYHPEHGARVVPTAAEAETLAGEGWFETPADFPPAPEPEPEKPTKKRAQ